MFSIVTRIIVAAGLIATAMPSLAQDPFVYRECMALCTQFKDRPCHVTCSYNACIAEKTRTNFGHGNSRGGLQSSQTDPGAWAAATAACYHWITILQQCGAGTPGAPPECAAGTPGAPPRTVAPQPARFDQPRTAKGNFVDRCYAFASGCDDNNNPSPAAKPSANAFCKSKGYTSVAPGGSQWSYKAPTEIQSSGQFCRDPKGCGGLDYVSCQ